MVVVFKRQARWHVFVVFLLISSMVAEAQGTQYFNQAVGYPPVCTSFAFNSWFFQLLNNRLNDCPMFTDASGNPKTIYYFSRAVTSAGTVPSDSNDGRDALGFGLSQATWNPTTFALTQSGAFARYTWTQGDQIYISGGTGVTPGVYSIAGQVNANTITLGTSIGSSASSNVTSSNGPKTTITAAAALAAAQGTIALLFHRGDVWQETKNGFPVNLVISHSYTTVAAYGSTSLPKPVLSAFAPAYSSTGWLPVSGTRQTFKRTENNTVAWLRKTMDTTDCLPLMASATEVVNTPGSWWQDTTAHVLYLHPANGQNPAFSGGSYESVYINDQDGIAIGIQSGNTQIATPDGTRVDNMRVDGYGADLTTGNGYYGFHALLINNAGWVATYCEAYFNGRHNFGATTNEFGGITTLIGCKAGFTSNDTQFVTYAGTGGQETILYQCECVAGVEPESQTAAGMPYQYQLLGGAFTGHSSNNAVYKSSLAIFWENVVDVGPWQTTNGFRGIGNPGTISGAATPQSLTDYLTFVVGETFPDRPQAPYDVNTRSFALNPALQGKKQVQLVTPNQWSELTGGGMPVILSGGGTPDEQISVNGVNQSNGLITFLSAIVGQGRTSIRFNIGTTDNDAGVISNSQSALAGIAVINSYLASAYIFDMSPNQNRRVIESAASGLFINCTLVLDLSGSAPTFGPGATTSSYYKTGTNQGTGTAQFYNCRIHMILPLYAHGGFDQLALAGTQATGIVAINSIFSADYPTVSSTFQPGLGNVIGNQINNAYVNCTSRTGMGGYSNDPTYVELQGPLVFGPPAPNSPLFATLLPIMGNTLQYDANWNARSLSGDYIGPYTVQP